MDLNRASTFVRVVEAGGFTAAASALGLPTSSVSRAVSRLEEELGVVLLERTTRKVSLTDAGRAYFERVRDALAGLDEANALALDVAHEPQGVVRLAAPPDLAPAMVAVLGEFLRENPRIRVEITFTARAAELVGDLADVGIAAGRLPDSSLVSRRLGTTEHQLFAAPAYLAARGAPRTLADLVQHDAIALASQGGFAQWELEGPGGVESVQVPAPVSGDHMGFVVEAAMGGLGIALLPALVVHGCAKNGRLVGVLPQYKVRSSMQLLTRSGRHLPRRVALLRDHLARVLAGGCVAVEKSGGCAGP